MKRIPRINPFFIEIIIVILFFSISVLGTLHILVLTHKMSNENSDLNNAMIVAQNTAEEIKALSGQSSLDTLLPQSEKQEKEQGTVYTLNYDKDWESTTAEPCYTLNMLINQERNDNGILISAEIKINQTSTVKKNSKNTIYELSVVKYLSGAA